MCRRKKNVLAICKEIAAGRAALARAYQLHVAAVKIHGEDLIAGKGRACGLKDDALVVEAPIGLGGILPFAGQLLERTKMRFLRHDE